MLIDWFTVGAQVLNFVVLVWLMKHFLYQPVLDAIAAREKRIADQITDAASQQAKAATERKTFEDKNTAFDKQRADLLVEATAQAEAEGQRLREQAQTTAEAAAVQREKGLAQQAAHLQQLIASRAANEVLAVARKTLADLAGADLEERMVMIFTQRLSELPTPAHETLSTALKTSTEPAVVRSHYQLSTEQQDAVNKATELAFGPNISLRFETAPDAICGIELSASGQKLAWTIDEYLRELEQHVAELLVKAAKPAQAVQSAVQASPISHKPDTGQSPHPDAVPA